MTITQLSSGVLVEFERGILSSYKLMLRDELEIPSVLKRFMQYFNCDLAAIISNCNVQLKFVN